MASVDDYVTTNITLTKSQSHKACGRADRDVKQTLFGKEVPASARVGLLNIKTDNKSINQIYCTVKYI